MSVTLHSRIFSQFPWYRLRGQVTSTPPPFTYLSERFTRDDFAAMTNDMMYAFYSAPDTGKTTLIANILQPYLRDTQKKALYLSPRKSINDQNKKRFDSDVIHSLTYQQLETYLLHNHNFFKDYDFIICDEAHYFIEDSAMNDVTDESFNFINSSNSVVILMSGTPECLEGVKDLWQRPISILADIDRDNHNLSKVCLASDTKEEGAFLKSELSRLVDLGKRIIIYDSNIADLFQLSNDYRQKAEALGIKVSFICSSHNKRYHEFSDSDALQVLIDTEHIDASLLFITSALNTGISIDEDFDYLFIFGNPSKTDIFQLVARIRRGTNGRRINTVYCSVPKYNSIKCRMDGLLFDLTYLDDPVMWQNKRKTRNLPAFMQVRHSYKVDSNGKQLYDSKGNPLTDAQPANTNNMKLGKVKQDISEYRSLLGCGNMMEAYRQLFTDRYHGITITSLKEELERRCVEELVSMLEGYSVLEYLGYCQKMAIKALCVEYGLLNSISKINELLGMYSCGLRLKSDQKKTGGHKLQCWQIERYESCSL